jgi:hypothetical protein
MEYHSTTPLPQTISNDTPAVNNVTTISKATVLNLISKFPFEELSLPTTVVSNDETQTIPFLEALGSSLITTLISLVPKPSSPEKLISSSTLSLPQTQPEQESPTTPRNTIICLANKEDYWLYEALTRNSVLPHSSSSH